MAIINTELFNALIEEQGLSNFDLNLKTGIDIKRITAIRNGKALPNAKEIQAFSESLKLTDRKRRAVFFNRKFAIRLQRDGEAT